LRCFSSIYEQAAKVAGVSEVVPAFRQRFGPISLLVHANLYDAPGTAR
jgi:hypothetical protein